MAGLLAAAAALPGPPYSAGLPLPAQLNSAAARAARPFASLLDLLPANGDRTAKPIFLALSDCLTLLDR